MSLSRRRFIKYAGMTAGSMALPIMSLNRAMAQTLNGKTLVVVYQRFGADGLDMVPPTGVNVISSQLNAYHELRSYQGTNLYLPSINPALELDGYFELHPYFADLYDIFNEGKLAIVHAVGGSGSRSHFDAQDHTEWAKEVNGAGNINGVFHDGLRQLLFETTGSYSLPPVGQMMAGGISMTSGMDKFFDGGQYREGMISLTGINNFTLQPYGAERTLLREMYSSFTDFTGLKDSTLSAMEILDELTGLPDSGIAYDNHEFSRTMKDVAKIIRTGKAPPFMSVNLQSWDFHTNLRTSMDAKIPVLNNGLKSFYDDLVNADKLDTTCVLVMTEFGRTLDRNDGLGLDHGNGAVMFVMGGGIQNGKGGQVVTDWPGLPIPTYSGSGDNETVTGSLDLTYRDTINPNASIEETSGPQKRLLLPATTDYRQVYRDILEDFHGITDTSAVFGYNPDTGANRPLPKLGLFTTQ